MPILSQRTKPTIVFIGVTTEGSSIYRVFPAWARRLGLEAEILGLDLAPRSDPAVYREAVRAIREDPLVRGAAITTHKLALFAACRDVFDEIDSYAEAMTEASCISKRDERLRCSAKDPITSGLALASFVPQTYFALAPTDVFAIGAGGSSIALTWHLMRRRPGIAAPARIFISDRDPDRLAEIARIHRDIETDCELFYVLADRPAENDAVLARLQPGSLVVNATGLGKDAPGSPLTAEAVFPHHGIAWDFNYRGELVFLDLARAQRHDRELQIEDGWTYFVHGWLAAVAEIFEIDIPSAGPLFEALKTDAADAMAAIR